MSTSKQPRKLAAFFVFGFIALITVAMRLAQFYIPLGRDGGAFAYVGTRILAGDLPYRDVWDHKTPAVYYLDALALTLFGHSVASLRSLEIIFALATAWSIYLLALKSLQNNWAATLAAFSFALVSNSYLFSVNGDLHFTETFMLLPIVLGIMFAVTYDLTRHQRYLWGVGLMAGWASLIKQPGGFFLAAVIFWLIGLAWQERVSWDRIIACLASLIGGLICPLALTVAYFALREGLSDLSSQVLGYNLLYVRSNLQTGSLRILASQAVGWLIALGFLWLPAGTGLIWGRAISRTWSLFVMWFVADLAGAWLGGRYYPHYFLQTLPSLTLLAGSGWLVLKERRWLLPRGGRNVTMITTILATLIILFIGQFRFTRSWISFRGAGNLDTTEQMAQLITANTTREETIYVWGAEAVIYFLADRQSASRYIYLYPLLARNYTSPERVNELLQDLSARQPRYIVDASAGNELIPPLVRGLSQAQNDPMYAQDELDPVRLFISQQYKPQTQVAGWILYERVGLDEN